jgi:hypothetical protein
MSSTGISIRSSSCFFIERPLRCGQPDTLKPHIVTRRSQRFEPFERQREMRPALARYEGVNLIDDDRIDIDEPLTRPGRQQQKQRLGRGDENVCPPPPETGAFVRRRVTGSN